VLRDRALLRRLSAGGDAELSGQPALVAVSLTLLCGGCPGDLAMICLPLSGEKYERLFPPRCFLSFGNRVPFTRLTRLSNIMGSKVNSFFYRFYCRSSSDLPFLFSYEKNEFLKTIFNGF